MTNRQRLFSTRGNKSKLLKLTDKELMGLYKNVEAGVPFDVAGHLLGISKTTIYQWIKKGTAFIDAEPYDQNPQHEIYAQFQYYIKRSRARYFAGLIRSINDSSPDNVKWDRDWKILVRRDSKNWGRGSRKAKNDNQALPDKKYL